MTKQQGGWVLAIGGAVAIAVGIYEAKKGPADVGCALSTAGVAAIVDGASKSHSGEAIVLTAGLGSACVPVVNAAINHSSDNISFKLESGNGSENVTTPADQLLASPPTRTQASSLACLLRYPNSAFLYQSCRDGLISP